MDALYFRLSSDREMAQESDIDLVVHGRGLDYFLKLLKNVAMVLREVPGYLGVIKKLLKVARRQHEMEYIIAVRSFNHFQIPLDALHFLFHSRHLFDRQTIHGFCLGVIEQKFLGSRYQQCPDVVDRVIVGGNQELRHFGLADRFHLLDQFEHFDRDAAIPQEFDGLRTDPVQEISSDRKSTRLNSSH